MTRWQSLPVASAPVRLVVMQPTAFCNIDCKYCYLPTRSDKGRMSFEVVDLVYDRVRTSAFATEPVTFAWHAGEPLAAGLDFFEYAFERSAHIGAARWTHNVQTNGTLIDDRWAELFSRYGTRIGLSIDGPEFLHDRMRVDRFGNGTLTRVLRGLDALRKRDIDPAVIMVVGRASLSHADEIFEFFLAHGLRNVGINVEEQEGSHRSSTLTSLDVYAWKRFLRRLLELQERSERRVVFREFEPFIPLLSGTAKMEYYSGARSSCATPLQILNVDKNGNMSTFCPELVGTHDLRYDNFVMGNVRSDEIDAILLSPAYLRMSKEIETGIEKCRRECAHFGFCGGGQPANKYFEGGSFAASETRYCRFRKKALTDVMLDYVEEQRLGGVTSDRSAAAAATSRIASP
jgi:uncharacterized protein